MNLESKLAILVDKLRLPNGAELEPWLSKLIQHPGSLVIIAIEQPLSAAGPRVGTAWLSDTERVKIRKALISVNHSRAKKDESQTTEIPR